MKSPVFRGETTGKGFGLFPKNKTRMGDVDSLGATHPHILFLKGGEIYFFCKFYAGGQGRFKKSEKN
jgi:hypothetical protein